MNYKFVAALVALVKAEGFNEMLQNGGVCKDIQKERQELPGLNYVTNNGQFGILGPGFGGQGQLNPIQGVNNLGGIGNPGTLAAMSDVMTQTVNPWGT